MRLVSSLAAIGLAVAPAPKALFQALLTARVGSLPAGFTSASTSRAKPGATSKRHHVVGEVEIDVDGGRATIVYVVFPSHADALANHADAMRQLERVKGVESVSIGVRGLPGPSVIVEASASGVGVTQVTFVANNVEVATQTLVAGAKQGKPAATVRLATYALAHLRAVQRRVR